MDVESRNCSACEAHSSLIQVWTWFGTSLLERNRRNSVKSSPVWSALRMSSWQALYGTYNHISIGSHGELPVDTCRNGSCIQ